MSFAPIYYLTSACPTLEKTMEMAERYIQHGARALQFDLPSRDPVLETPLVQECMRQALERSSDDQPYLRAFAALKRRHPHLQLHLVVYPDVIERIGKEAFAEYCRSISFASVMIAQQTAFWETWLQEQHLPLWRFLTGALREDEVRQAAAADPRKEAVVLSYKRHAQGGRPDCPTFAQKVQYLRRHGVTAPIYAVEGIADARMMQEVRDAGTNGALVGNILMQLWGEENALWTLFDAFQKLADVPEVAVAQPVSQPIHSGGLYEV